VDVGRTRRRLGCERRGPEQDNSDGAEPADDCIQVSVLHDVSFLLCWSVLRSAGDVLVRTPAHADGVRRSNWINQARMVPDLVVAGARDGRAGPALVASDGTSVRSARRR
jgi:hypothetical protein